MQGDVHANPGPSAGYAPYLLDVQADLLAELDTRVVVPLIRAEAFGRRISRLHPGFTVADQAVVMATHLIAAVRRSTLGPALASLQPQHDEIVAAIDVLLSGI
ncbi:MAG: CcdB family protein [Acetobacteraceae bacterium]